MNPRTLPEVMELGSSKNGRPGILAIFTTVRIYNFSDGRFCSQSVNGYDQSIVRTRLDLGCNDSHRGYEGMRVE